MDTGQAKAVWLLCRIRGQLIELTALGSLPLAHSPWLTARDGRRNQSCGVRNTRPTGVHEAVEGVTYVYGSTEPALLEDGRE